MPEEIRETGGKTSVKHTSDGEPKAVTWIIEIHSQILFSNSASVNFELLVGRDERSLDYGFAAVASHGQGAPGQVEDHQQGKNRHEGRHPAQPKGVYSRAVRLVVDDTTSLWNKPELPEWDDEDAKSRTSKDGHETAPQDANTVKRQKNIHIVIVTHGLHSNLGADMLYVKESIDAAAKQAREEVRERRRAARRGASSDQDSQDKKQDSSTAPLSGGQEDLYEDGAEDDDPNEEEVIVRGFGGNAVRTERGIQYLGKRLAKYVLAMTYPDQPYLPIKKSMKNKMSNTFSSTKPPADDGVPAHSGSTVHHQRHPSKHEKRAYRFTSISFVGHSLGGLVQTYAIAYIHKHSPEFFHKIKPINFICMSSPLLGLSNENPMYVKFALDFGLVGRTGQDLGLTWRPPTIARGGWAAMVSGFGAAPKEPKAEDPGAKPLLRILPTGPAHQVLRMFRNRTVYSNVVNDGVVPLRTSCLLFLDWKGLGRVEKARRGNGLVGTLASWGFAELTGQNSSPNPSRVSFDRSDDGSGTSTPVGGSSNATVPQPAEDAVNQDQTATTSGEPQANRFLSEQQKQAVQEATLPESPRKNSAPSTPTKTTPPSNPFTGFISYLKGATTTPKDKKMFKRSQTVQQRLAEEQSAATDPPDQPEQGHRRPLASRGDSTINNELAPPKTTIFESAGDILNPPIPPTSWIIDPASRSRTIFHDRIYHPEDIPPPPVKRPKSLARSFSSDHSITSVSTADSVNESSGGMRVEEKIARSYHKDLSWRKVLVRLEPDAHNNIVVRRMFANAYGWPVIKHLCDTHFANTYSARTRDEQEPATDRAEHANAANTAAGEEVEGQRAKAPPPQSPSEMREAADELAPLRHDGTGGIVSDGTGSSSYHHHELHSSHSGRTLRREDSSLWDDSYFEGGTEDESDDNDDNDAQDNRGYFQRFLSPAPPGRNRKKTAPTSSAEQAKDAEDQSQPGTSAAEIAGFLTAKAAPSQVVVEGHRGLAPTAVSPTEKAKKEPLDKGKKAAATEPVTAPAPNAEEVPLPSPSGSTITPVVTAEVGLRKSVEEHMGSPVVERSSISSGANGGVAEEVAKAFSGAATGAAAAESPKHHQQPS